MATTRVSVAPIEGGPNDVPSLHSQAGIFKNRKFSGSGSDTDIITSSARAYTSALNKLLSWNARRAQQAMETPVTEEEESAKPEVVEVQP
mmetsp:Transcript_95259/g.132328  ORF Transcript_95259/g.132328 Transcript_95259/m.132328 type:complete len:90 (-) Transcript_95259:25-294(-)